jgi:hypothetical protein
MQLYQIRLKGEQPIAVFLGELTKAFVEAMRRWPEFADLRSEEESELNHQLRAVFKVYVRAYDLCGSQALCEQGLNPSGWNKNPDPELSARLPWQCEEIRRFRLEANTDVGEFPDALAAAAMRAVVRTPARSAHVRDLKRVLVDTAIGLVGPHTYENPACGQCELCRESRPVNVWNT